MRPKTKCQSGTKLEAKNQNGQQSVFPQLYLENFPKKKMLNYEKFHFVCPLMRHHQCCYPLRKTKANQTVLPITVRMSTDVKPKANESKTQNKTVNKAQPSYKPRKPTTNQTTGIMMKYMKNNGYPMIYTTQQRQQIQSDEQNMCNK